MVYSINVRAIFIAIYCNTFFFRHQFKNPQEYSSPLNGAHLWMISLLYYVNSACCCVCLMFFNLGPRYLKSLLPKKTFSAQLERIHSYQNILTRFRNRSWRFLGAVAEDSTNHHQLLKKSAISCSS